MQTVFTNKKRKPETPHIVFRWREHKQRFEWRALPSFKMPCPLGQKARNELVWQAQLFTKKLNKELQNAHIKEKA